MRGKEKTRPLGLLQDVTDIKPDTRPYRGRMKERNEEGRRSEQRHGRKVLLKDRSRVSNDRPLFVVSILRCKFVVFK